MAIQQLVYTKTDIATSAENPNTFVLMVEGDMYEKYKTDKSIPVARVVNSYDIMKYDSGKSGTMSRPSQAELKDSFGMTNEDELAEFMLANGYLHGKPAMQNAEPGREGQSCEGY